jgi:hypothetical protein
MAFLTVHLSLLHAVIPAQSHQVYNIFCTFHTFLPNKKISGISK